MKKCTKTKEYYENEEYVITSLFGHILELYKMEDYNKEFKVWDINDLPFFPDNFKWKIKTERGMKERYNIIQDLILRDDIEIIINCGDSDREGEVLVNNIIYDIFRKNKIKKPIKRILLPDLSEATIRSELKNLRDIEQTENWYKEGLARTYVDWLYGINFSRFVSLKAKDKFPVGRVIVPTVRYVYDREMEIRNFKESKYFQIEGIITKDDKEIKIEFGEKYNFNEEEKETIKQQLQEQIKKLQNEKTIVSEIQEKETIRKPKKLFSLKSLQNYMFNKYKINLSKTLDYVQILYEKTYTTYPRTNSEYLTNEEKEKVSNIINTIVRQEKLNIAMKDDKRIFDSSKVESHSAIIITSNKVNEDNLTKDESNVYNSIRNRFLANFCNEDCIVKEQIIKIQIQNEDLISKIKGTSIKQQGYLQFENDLNEKEIPIFKEGEVLNIKFQIVEKKTNPPQRVTEAELNNFYENPFKRQEQEETTDEDYIAILKGAEIGTPATRSNIIEKVKNDVYVKNNKNYLEITDKGISLIKILDSLNINLYKDKTVEIGQELKAIYNNEKNIDDILLKVRTEIEQGINKNIEIKEYQKQSIEKCPICHHNIYESSKSYYCENWKECGFSILKRICEKNISEAVAKELIEKGYTKKMKGFKSKAGKSFSASLVIEDNKVKLNFD